MGAACIITTCWNLSRLEFLRGTAVAQFVLDGNDQVTRLVLEQTESEALTSSNADNCSPLLSATLGCREAHVTGCSRVLRSAQCTCPTDR